MKELFLYTNDYKYNVRDTECSRTVVNSWFDECVRYAEEKISDHGCLKLVAERLVVRHLLGMKNLDAWDLNCVARIQPFGDDGPLVAELMLPNVFYAMAFFPLTPANTKGNPTLARLYCVKGLPNSYNTLPLEGMSEVASPEVSWFLEGVPKEDLKKGIQGRSWLLAAHLLRQVVNTRSLSTARNLMKHYIVTGDVRDGLICPVEIGRKEELSKQKLLRDFKWIIPKENDMNIPRRKVEKPETLEEAYKLIESMRNTATKSFFRFLREGDLEGVKEQYRIGADLFGNECDSNMTSLEVIASEKSKLYSPRVKEMPRIPWKSKKEDVKQPPEMVDIEVFKKGIRERIMRLDEIEKWLRSKGVGAAELFYLLAVNGDEEGVARNCDTYPINLCDENGLTAVDRALIEGEYDAAKLLHRHGGIPNTRWQVNQKLRERINCLCHYMESEFLTREDTAFIAKAIEVGLSPETRVCLVLPSSECPSNVECSLFAAAVDSLEYDIVEACLKKGIDVNKELVASDEHYMPFIGDFITNYVKFKGTPWQIISKREIPLERRNRFRELFRKYGAVNLEDPNEK